MWESRVLRRAFERLELHEGKLSRAVRRGGGGGDVTSLPDAGVGNHPGLPGPRAPQSAREGPTNRDACQQPPSPTTDPELFPLYRIIRACNPWVNRCRSDPKSPALLAFAKSTYRTSSTNHHLFILMIFAFPSLISVTFPFPSHSANGMRV